MSHQVKTADLSGNTYLVDAGKLQWRPSAYAVIVKDGKLLLTKQIKAYSLPGGAIEFGELPEEAVLREVYEETGIVANNPRLLTLTTSFFAWPGENGTPDEHYQTILLYYRCDMIGGELSIEGLEEGWEQENSELPEWVPFAQLDTLPVCTTVDWLSIVRPFLKEA